MTGIRHHAPYCANTGIQQAQIVATGSRERARRRRTGRGIRRGRPHRQCSTERADDRLRRLLVAGRGAVRRRSPASPTPKWIRPIPGTPLSSTSRWPRRSPPVSSTVSRNPARQPRGKVGVPVQFLHSEAGQSRRCRPDARRLRQSDVRAAEPRRQDVDRAGPCRPAAATTPRPSRTPRSLRTRS